MIAYYSIARHTESRLRWLKKRSRWLNVAQIASFLCAAAMLAVAILAVCKWPYVIAAALSLIAYLLLRKSDGDNSQAIRHNEALLQAYRNEIAYLHGDYSHFADGSQYINPSHPYSFDLDLFGPSSLFQRLCRCVSSGGSDKLAAWLNGAPLSSRDMQANATNRQTDTQQGQAEAIQAVQQRAGTIAELSTHTGLLMAVKACKAGMNTSEHTSSPTSELLSTQSLVQALEHATTLHLPRRCTSPFARAVRYALLAGFYASVAMAALSWVPASLPITWGAVNLLLGILLPGNSVRRAAMALQVVQSQLSGFRQIVSAVGEEDFTGQELQGLQRSLLSQASQLSELEAILHDIDNRNNEAGICLFNIFMLIDPGIVYRLARWQRKGFPARQFAECLSTIDALVSLATYSANEPHTVQAEWVDSPTLIYEGQGLRHPFLRHKAVPNDASLTHRHFYIITGANMAGKSTFLRTLGINAVLASIGLPVCATHLRLSPFRLFTGMRTSDDLTHGISYFNAELLRLEQLVKAIDNKPTLVILDEILKGTNSRDKLNGSRLFLEYLANKNVTAVVATHDLELSHMADEHPNRFHNYCFEIELGDAVKYSYRISQGTARNQNATFLLKRMLEEYK